MIIEIGGNTNIRRDVQCAALTLELPTIKVRKLKTYKILWKVIRIGRNATIQIDKFAKN